MVKCAAEDRGWPHNGHRQLQQVIDRLVEETGDGDIRPRFNAAGALHANFYEGWLSRQAVGRISTMWRSWSGSWRG